MLVTCPNCGPREVQELRCAGETTKRPTQNPTVRELNEYVYFRETSGACSANGGSAARVRTGSWPSGTRIRTRSRGRGIRSGPRDSWLEPRLGERIDRSLPVTFSFHGKAVQAFEGDTIGSALFASGRRVFSRSFKYHRPRGLACCSGHCANCQMTVDGIPSVRVCVTPVTRGCGREGAELSRLARARPDAGDRQARRPVHAARLLLQDVHPAAQAVAAVREGAARCGGPRPARSGGRALRAGGGREPPRRRRGDRRRTGRARGRDRGGAAR